MPQKMNPPPECDLTLSCRKIALLNGVGMSTAHRWKREAGVFMKRGARGPGGMHRISVGLWGKVTEGDWKKGCTHVGGLLGVSRQAAQNMRRRIRRYRQDGLRVAGGL